MNAIADDLQHEMHLVIENLDRREWVQGVLQAGEAVCLHGAVMTCQGLKPGDEYIIRAVMRRRGLTEDWNDTDGRTKAEVLARMRLIEVSDVDLADTFGPNWRQVIAVVRRAAILTTDEAQRLSDTWADVRDTTRDAAWDAVWDAVWDPVAWTAESAARDAARDAAWDAEGAAGDAAIAVAVSDLVGQHGLTQDHIDTLMKPWVEVLGPDWAEGMAE